jgi:hypothetical protein
MRLANVPAVKNQSETGQHLSDLQFVCDGSRLMRHAPAGHDDQGRAGKRTRRLLPSHTLALPPDSAHRNTLAVCGAMHKSTEVSAV